MFICHQSGKSFLSHLLKCIWSLSWKLSSSYTTGNHPRNVSLCKLKLTSLTALNSWHRLLFIPLSTLKSSLGSSQWHTLGFRVESMFKCSPFPLKWHTTQRQTHSVVWPTCWVTETIYEGIVGFPHFTTQPLPIISFLLPMYFLFCLLNAFWIRKLERRWGNVCVVWFNRTGSCTIHWYYFLYATKNW